MVSRELTRLLPTAVSLSNKLSIKNVDLKGKKALIRSAIAYTHALAI